MPNPGTYEEPLPCGGKLKVTKSSWLIEYYFSGPDMRYNGDFVRVQSSQVDSYITALKDNWDKYCEMKKTSPKEANLTPAERVECKFVLAVFETVYVYSHITCH